MSEKKVSWFSTYRYVAPSDYEQFLERMAAEGWYPDKIGQLSSLRMRFHRGTPKKYRYIFDCQPAPRREYRRTYEDFGWEYLGKMASCFIWRKEYSDKRPESFSDEESLRRRNRTIWTVLLIGTLIFAAAFVAVAATFAVCAPQLTLERTVQFLCGLLLSGALALYFFWAMRKVKRDGGQR